MDNLEFLDGEPSGEESRADTARDEKGRFAPKAQEEAAPAEQPPVEAASPQEPTTAPAPPESKPEPGHVPLTVVLDEREKRQAAERAKQELEERLRALEAQRQQQPIPDRNTDPEGWEDWRAQQFEQRLLNERLNTSERFARKEHGADVVDAARDAALQRFQNDPLYYQQVMSAPDPYEVVVQDYKRAQALSALSEPGRLDAFLAWQAGQSAAPAQPNHQAASAPPPSPPRSLASQPAAGAAKPGEQPVGEGVAFDAIFAKG